MKKALLAAIVVCASSTAFGQTVTTTTTVGSGTITEYSPGTSMIVKEEAGPVTYRYGENVTYVGPNGAALTQEEVQTRIKVGTPVSVSYTTEGETRVIDRVELSEDDEVEIDDGKVETD